MKEELKAKLISIIPDDPIESDEEIEDRKNLKVILSRTRTPFGDFKKILIGKENLQTYLNIGEIFYNLKDISLSLEEQSEIVLFLLENNINYFNNEYISDIKNALEHYFEKDMTTAGNMIKNSLEVDEEVINYAIKMELDNQVNIAIKFHTYIKKLYMKLKKYFNNGKFKTDNIEEIKKILLEVGAEEQIIDFILSNQINNEIKKEKTKEISNQKEKEIKKLEFELNKLLSIKDKYITENQINDITNLMMKLDYSEEDINKRIKEIKNSNLCILEEQRNNKVNEILNNYLSPNEREILNKGIEYKDNEYAEKYGVITTLNDINEILEELVNKFDIENIELLKLLILELKDELLNIELIFPKLEYKPNIDL